VAVRKHQNKSKSNKEVAKMFLSAHTVEESPRSAKERGKKTRCPQRQALPQTFELEALGNDQGALRTQVFLKLDFGAVIIR
jgi:hypothetical protein